MDVVFPGGRRVPTNGIELVVHEAGRGPAVVLLHGFPELAFSWRHQIDVLAGAGFRVIAPDQRGYGDSDGAPDGEAFTMKTLVADVVGVLDALEIEKAVLVGHDFGGMVAWHGGVHARERVAGIASLCTPHGPRGRTDFVHSYRRLRGPRHYMTAFQDAGVAEAVLEADVEATFRALMRRRGPSLAEFRALPREVQQVPIGVFVGDPPLFGEPLLDEEELAVYVEAFRRTGFAGGLNWYRSLHRTWEECEGLDMTIDKPALFLQAADDIFLPADFDDRTSAFVPGVERHVIESCGHWVQQERPAEVNAILLPWLLGDAVGEALK